MTKGLYQYYSDLQFIFKRPLFILSLFLYPIAMASIYITHSNLGPIDAIFITEKYTGSFSTCLSFLLIIRLYRTTGTWVTAYPISSVCILISKWLSAMTYMFTINIMSLVIFYFGAHHWGFQGPTFWSIMGLIFLNSLFIYALTTSLGLFIVSVIRKNLAYLIGLLVWLFFSFLFPLFVTDKFNWFPFNTKPFMDAIQQYGPFWGLSLAQGGQAKLWWMLLTLSIFFFLLAVVITVLKRPTKNIWTPTLSLIIGIGLLSGSLITYFQYWSTQLSELQEHQDVSILKKDANDYPSAPFTVNNVQIDAFHDDNVWTIYSKLQITMPEVISSPKFSFTINPDFSVEQVTINGRIVDYSQHGGWIDLSIKDIDPSTTRQSVSFIYSGQLDEWGIDGKTGKEKWFGFTKKSIFYVPAYLAWYPLPGRTPLYIKESNNFFEPLQGNAITKLPVSYSIRLHGYTKPVFSTSITEDRLIHHVLKITTTNLTGVTLFSGNYETWESKNVSVVMPTYYDHLRSQLTSQISSLRDYLQDTFKMPITGKIVFLPINNPLFKGTQRSGNALIFPSDHLKHLFDHEVSDSMENEMIDYFLTGGKLLQKRTGDTNSINEDYIQAIRDLYHYKSGQFDTVRNKEWYARKVENELKNK